MKRMMLTFVMLIFAAAGVMAQENTTKVSAKAVRDVVYKTVNGEQIKLNLFLPLKDGKLGENVPLLIWMDSGCWYSSTSKAGNGGFWASARALEKGFAVASVAHRSLSNGNIFPSQIEDVRAAVRYLRAHAQEYGLDPNRFAASGASSGGHLCSMLGVPDKIFDVGENLEYSGQVNLVVEFYGPASPYIWINNPPKSVPSCMYQVVGVPKEDLKPIIENVDKFNPMAKKCSPMTYVNADFAPTLILHGVMDTTVPVSQSVLFYESLLKAKVRTKLCIHNTGVHQIKSLGKTEDLAKIIFTFIDWKP
ncbi:MAG: alpha/beta hydrolase [Fibrobacter sp.]|nr:alpha/beta hydrolase [Fibrobacter sp.]